MASTISAIRDRIITLIEALTPASMTGNKFLVSRDEGAAEFAAWAESNPTACLRRFQVRHDGADETPFEVSSVDVELRRAVLTVIVAYPLTHRYGESGGRSRDDVMFEDWKKIAVAIGPGYGRANFSGSHDCTIYPLRRAPTERGESCDFMVIEVALTYYIDADA